MTPEPPNSSRDILEARLTALLLGELPEAEAAALRHTIAEDAALGRLHDRLKLAITLVRETVAAPEGEAAVIGETPKLAPERREKLLESLRVPAPKQVPPSVQRRVSWNKAKWKELATLAAMIVGLLGTGAALLVNSDQESRSSGEPSHRFAYFASREGRAPLRTTSIPGGGAPALKLNSGSANGERLSAAVELLTPPPSTIPPIAPAANVPTRLPRNLLGLALPSLDDAAQSEAPGSRDGRERQAAKNELTIVQSDFFNTAGQEGFGNGRESLFLDRSRAGGRGGVGGMVGGETASRTTADKNLPSQPRQNVGALDSPSAGLVANNRGVVAPGGTPSPMPVAAAKIYDNGFGSLDGVTITGVRKGASAGVDTIGGARIDGAEAGRPLLWPATPAGEVRSGLDSIDRTFSFSSQPVEEQRAKEFDALPLKPSDPETVQIAQAETTKPAGNLARNNAVQKPVSVEDSVQLKSDSYVVAQVTNASSGSNMRVANSAFASQNDGAGIVPQEGFAFGDHTQPVPLPAFGAGFSGEGLAKLKINGGSGAESFHRQRINLAGTTDAKDAMDEKKLAEISKSETIADRLAPAARPLESDVERLDSKSARNSGRVLGEKPEPAGASTVEAKIKNFRVDIALPNRERGEVREGFQVATGTVTDKEIAVGDPAPNLRVTRRSSETNSAYTGSGPTELLRNLDSIPPSGVPQPEIPTTENAFSTFSLNVSDVSFKLAAASLEKGQMPDPATVRSEEFINVFDYRDPDPKGSAPIAFAWERARYPFAHDRDLLRFSVKTAASGRQPGRPLNLVLLLDNSGSMERADRVRILRECLRVLAGQLQPQDRVSVVAFARTPRLWVDGLPGNQAGELPERVGGLTPQGGTNLEDAMTLAYQTALRHFLAHGVNRVVLLTDGAANLGDVQPESLKKKVEAHRRQGIALDCFGIGWEGFNDELLETLSRNGDGRYGFVNTPEAATSEFAGQLAGALKVAASDVKVQVEFNPRRATAYRQIGYAKHQLKKEQFRDNTVDAAEIGAAEAGNALYVVQVNPAGEGPIGTVRVRFKVPGTSDYREHEWPVPYEGAAKSLEQSSAALRLAASASAFSEWLVSSPYAGEVTPGKLLGYLNGVPETWPADPRPKKLEWMIRQARSVSGK